MPPDDNREDNEEGLIYKMTWTYKGKFIASFITWSLDTALDVLKSWLKAHPEYLVAITVEKEI